MCRRPLVGRHVVLESGDRWCVEHESMPHCAWCRIPTALRHGTTPRCARCASGAVDRDTDLTAMLHHVGRAMSNRGLVVQRHVDLVLSDPAGLQQRGIHWGNPHNLGVTQSAVDPSGRTQGAITIGIVSGLPDELFRAVLVHEFAHAYFASLVKRPTIEPIVEEGYAEALAYDYLEHDLANQAAGRLLRSMQANTDPVYGGGLRLMLPHVQQRGALEVAHAVAQGTIASRVVPAAPGPRGRRMRPVRG